MIGDFPIYTTKTPLYRRLGASCDVKNQKLSKDMDEFIEHLYFPVLTSPKRRYRVQLRHF